LYKQTTGDVDNSYFGAANVNYKPNGSFSSIGKRRSQQWENSRLGGQSRDMELIPVKKEKMSRVVKQNFLSSSIMSFH